jgi:hypothetical protein
MGSFPYQMTQFALPRSFCCSDPQTLLCKRIHLPLSVGANLYHSWWPPSTLSISYLPRKTLVPPHSLKKRTSLGQWIGLWAFGWVTRRARIWDSYNKDLKAWCETEKVREVDWNLVFWGRRGGNLTFIHSGSSQWGVQCSMSVYSDSEVIPSPSHFLSFSLGAW